MPAQVDSMPVVAESPAAPGSNDPAADNVVTTKKKGGELLVIDCFGGGNTVSSGPSLQDRFKRFRKERKREKALAEQAHVNAAMSNSTFKKPDVAAAQTTTRTETPEEAKNRKEVLRTRFVDTCLSYLNVPYAQKKHTPDEEDYNAPIFLDCCGLVRKALQDLQDDFGFRIGKWNQAYQYETLNGPAIYGKQNFAEEGTCIHGGDGDDGVGSPTGVVATVPSPDHANPELTSPELEERAAKNADTTPKPKGYYTDISQLKPGDLVFVEGSYFDINKKPQRHKIVHVEVFLGNEYGNGQQTVGSRWGRTIPEENKVRGVQIHDSYVYVSKQYEIHRFIFVSIDPWLHGKCKSQSYPDAATKGFTHLHTGGKSIFEMDDSSDQDADCCLEKFTPYDFSGGDAITTTSNGGASDRAISCEQRPPIFYVGEGNNHKCVIEVLEKRGWKQLPFDAGYSSRFDFKWVEQRGKIDYARHIEGQLVNHIPNNDVITSKAKLLKLLNNSEDYKELILKADLSIPANQARHWIHPLSYSSEKGSEKLKALELAEKDEQSLWLMKPSKGLGGKGIELVRAKDLRSKLFPNTSKSIWDESRWHARSVDTETKESSCVTSSCAVPIPETDSIASANNPCESTRKAPPVEGWVIQKYVHPPLLLGGRKFDIRAYCLIARTDPALWFFHPGYCKLSLDHYYSDSSATSDNHKKNGNIDGVDLSNLFAHLTNASIQKQHPNYREQRGQHIWSLEKAEEDVKKQGKWNSDSDKKSFWKSLEYKMKHCLTFLYKESKTHLARKKGYFDLLGIDFMVGEDLSLYLLEVNSNPAIWFDSSDVLREMVPKLVANSVELVVNAQNPSNMIDADYIHENHNFELIVDEASGYVYDE